MTFVVVVETPAFSPDTSEWFSDGPVPYRDLRVHLEQG